MAIDSLSSSGSAAATAGSSNAALSAGNATGSLKADEQSDRFLKLLVAQMRNQDPLNPLDNAAVTTQMAQISTVEGIEKLNSSMKNFLDRGNSTGSLEGANLIGRRVLVGGNQLTLGALAAADGERAGASGGFELTEAAAVAQIEVLDSAGAVLSTQTLNAVDAGVHHFSWDGRDAAGNAVAAGQYQFRVRAGTASELAPVQALQAQNVSAVISSPTGLKIEVGGRTQVSLADIKAIL